MFASSKLDGGTPRVGVLAAAKTHVEGKTSPPTAIAQVVKLRPTVGELTPGGNLRCLQCRATAQELASSSDLPTAKALSLVEQITRYVLPILLLSGGEPLFPPVYCTRAYAHRAGRLPEGLLPDYKSRSSSLWGRLRPIPRGADELALQSQ